MKDLVLDEVPAALPAPLWHGDLCGAVTAADAWRLAGRGAPVMTREVCYAAIPA